MSGGHFSVDSTLISALASHKSFKPKDSDPGDPPDSNGWASFEGEKRTNDTHASTTDPDARMARKSQGTGAELAYAVNALMDNHHGLIADVRTDIVTGTIERDAALEFRAKRGGARPQE